MKNDKVYFLRHNLSVPGDIEKTHKVLEEIWHNKMAVIDYEALGILMPLILSIRNKNLLRTRLDGLVSYYRRVVILR